MTTTTPKWFLYDSVLLDYSITESAEGLLILRGKVQHADIKNDNNRVYRYSVLDKVLKAQKVRDRLRRRLMVGELEHPEDGITKFYRVSHLVTDLRWGEGKVVLGSFEIFDDVPHGIIVARLIRRGVPVGASTRGKGTSHEQDDVEFVDDNYDLETVDIVYNPSTPGAYPKPVKVAMSGELPTWERDEEKTSRKLVSLADDAGRVRVAASRGKASDEEIRRCERDLSGVSGHGDALLEKFCELINRDLKEARKMAKSKLTVPVQAVSQMIEAIRSDEEEYKPPTEERKKRRKTEQEGDEYEERKKRRRKSEQAEYEDEYEEQDDEEGLDDEEYEERKRRRKMEAKKKRQRKSEQAEYEDEYEEQDDEEGLDDEDEYEEQDEPEEEYEEQDDEEEKPAPPPPVEKKSFLSRKERKCESAGVLRKALVRERKLKNALVERARQLRAANSVLASKLDSSVDLIAKVVERVEAEKKRRILSRATAENPEMGNLLPVLERCSARELEEAVRLVQESRETKMREEESRRQEEAARRTPPSRRRYTPPPARTRELMVESQDLPAEDLPKKQVKENKLSLGRILEESRHGADSDYSRMADNLIDGGHLPPGWM